MLCVDHHSRFMWIYHLTHKSDVYSTFKNFVSLVERQFNTKLKAVQTDWGGEFRNLTPFFSSLGILHRRSCPHTSEQNGIVERRHRHVVETGLTLLAQASLPKRFWHYAFETAVYLINRLPSRVSSNMSPFQHVFQRRPDYSFLRTFGCQCFPFLRPYNHHKMDFRSSPCVFLGYSPHHHGYRCLDPNTDRIYIARHVRFNETCFPFHHPLPSKQPTSPDPYISSFPISSLPTDPHPHTQPPPNQPPPDNSISMNNSPIPSSSSNPPSSPSPSATTSFTPSDNDTTTPPPRQRPTNLRPNPKPNVRFSPSAYTTITSPTEPTSFTIANKSPEWRHAMTEEFMALTKNGTWSLVPPVTNANIIDCKWVYRLKKDSQGKITRYKARLVAKGFRQQPGIDYQETFSPVIKATTIRVLLSLAVSHKWPLRQLDVQNAFLHGSLTETVYIRQPQGFVDPTKPNHVCRLHKALYGLKQAPRAWFHRLSTVLHQIGFVGSKTDPSLFILKNGTTLLYVLVYVDDIIVTGNNNEAIEKLIITLGTAFAIKDLGDLHYFLGIEIVRQGANIILSQRKYILELLQRSGLTDCKPVSSPMSSSHPLALNDSPLLPEPSIYRQTVGTLQYVTLSRPDISFAVNKVCQYMHAPTEKHWTAVKRILRYLKGTAGHGLLLRHASGSTLHAFTDAHWSSFRAYSDSDWAGCPDDRRSTGGMLSTLDQISYHGPHVSNALYPALPPNQNTRPLLIP